MAHYGVDLSYWNMAVASGTSLASLDKLHNMAKLKGMAAGAHADNPDPFGTFLRSYSPHKFASKSFAAVTPGTKLVVPDYKTMLASDSRHIEFTYIKAQDGAGGYPTDPYYIEAALAALIAEIASSPYHYYLMDQLARDQAYALYNAILNACNGDMRLFGTMDPVCDLEDNTSARYKSFAWDGVTTGAPLTRAIANVLDFLKNILPLYLTTVDAVFSANLHRPVTTRLYSGPWFWQPMINLLHMGNSTENENVIKWYNNRLAFSAWYTGDHKPIPTIDPKKHFLEGCDNRVIQYTSTAVPPLVGLNVPGRDGVMGSAADLNVYVADESHYLYWTGLTKLPVKPGDPVVPPVVPPDDTERRLAALETLTKAQGAEIEELKAWRGKVKEIS